MAYFAAFLRMGELLDRLVADAPFEYASNNAPKVRDVVGTMLPAILAGFRRYCHIDRLRGDSACAELLGMAKVVSDESVRRALKRCDEAALDAWLWRHEREVTEALLQYAYIIDIDNSVKPVYGRQEGAEPGYSPEKPGRPSHNYHSTFVGTVRMTLTVDVRGGRSHSGTCGLPGLSPASESPSTPRRCLLVRRPAKEKPAAAPKRRGRPKEGAAVPVQQEFEFVEDRRGRTWDTFALVTNDRELAPVALTQPYRDRGDCENNFDEYKNQWGWAGFVTNKFKPTRAMARLIAIVANWWNDFCRLADGSRHMEPVTSRPMLLGLVGRIVRSGRRRLMHLTSTHVESERIRTALEAIGAFLGRISATASPLGFAGRWTSILRVAFRKFLGRLQLEQPSAGAGRYIPATT